MEKYGPKKKFDVFPRNRLVRNNHHRSLGITPNFFFSAGSYSGGILKGVMRIDWLAGTAWHG